MQREYDRHLRKKSNTLDNTGESAHRLQRHRDVQHGEQVSIDILPQERAIKAADFRKSRKIFYYEPNDDGYVDFGLMEHVCPYCSTKHYFDERVLSSREIRFYECFNSGKTMFQP